METLTSAEIRRLSVLKSARELGIWPQPVPQTFAERHGITLSVDAEPPVRDDRTVYRCTLSRNDGNASMVVRFQVTNTYPEPPTADEVLRWLAMSSAHLRHTYDFAGWESLHYLTEDGASERYPYRGLVRARSAGADFHETLLMEARRFYAFLGQQTFEALLVTVDAAG